MQTKHCGFWQCWFRVFLFAWLLFFKFSPVFQKKNISVLLSLGTLASWGVILLSARFYWMGNKPPNFSNSDNPAADSPHVLTRTLTFLHLPVANAWLLLCPDKLSFDWSMDAVPLVRSLADWRNLYTVAFYGGFVLLSLFGIRGRTSISKETNGKAYVTNGKSITNGNGYHAPDTNHNTDPAPVKTTLNGSAGLHHYPALTSLPPTENLVLFSLGIVSLPFIPATNLFFYVGFVIAERVLYIPSIGFCLLVAAGARHLYVRLRTRGCRAFMLCLCAGLVLLNGLRTVQRNRDWSNEENLYKSGISVNPAKGKRRAAVIIRDMCQRGNHGAL